jgi:hypothetical protein
MDIEKLIDIFSEHERKYLEDMKNVRDNFIKDYPNEKIPGWMESSFNVSEAFKDICVELLKIKQKLGLE